MRQHHANALDQMLTDARQSTIERILATEPDRLELIVLEKACDDPRRFPVHVLADDRVSAWVKHIRAKGTGLPPGGQDGGI